VTSADDLAEGYDYPLPPKLIAQRPAERRDDSRLLVLPKGAGAVQHRTFRELPSLLRPADCVVLNDTRVLPARLLGRRPTGGRVEVLLLSPVAQGEWECLVRPGSHLRPGARVRFGTDPWIDIEVLEVLDDLGRRRVRVEASVELHTALEAIGHVPLPPYIHRPDDAADRDRYQTV
jgi:S-adenosylmethionine:tRNA ribosyltransferase-isomerase